MPPPPRHAALFPSIRQVLARERVGKYIAILFRFRYGEIGCVNLCDVARLEVRPMHSVVTGYGVFVELTDSVMFKRNAEVFKSFCLRSNSGKQLDQTDGFANF